jgi:acyl-CoA reductase-like NAD-dependent aldehyde dehydrogenase
MDAITLDQSAFRFEDRAERNFVGGEWKFTREGYEFDIYDPSDSTVIASIPLSTHMDVRDVIASAKDALPRWSALPCAKRVRVIVDALVFLAENIDDFASIISRDTGLPARSARSDTLAAMEEMRCAMLSVGNDPSPGVIGQILSWSNPAVVCMRLLLADLASGNVAVVHPSIRAPLSLVWIADALNHAGAPGGVFNLIQGAGIDAGMALARQIDLKRLDFQGSRRTARMVSLSPRKNGIPVRTVFRTVKSVRLDGSSDIRASALELAEACFCHATRPGFGGAEVHIPLERLRDLSRDLNAAFAAARYGGAATDSTVAPYIAVRFRAGGERQLDAWLETGADLVCDPPAPDQRTYRMGWFAPPCALHDAAGNISLDPEAPNGPLILIRTR